MSSAVFLTFSAGILLSMAFRVWILVPIVSATVGGIWFAGPVLARGDNLMLVALAAAVALQVGYAFGLGVRIVLASVKSKAFNRRLPQPTSPSAP